MPPGEVRLLLLILGSLATDTALGDPCVTHTVLDQPWRSTDCSNTECSAGTWMGDGNLTVGWYRFNSSGGWKIPETGVPWFHCSGWYPGWLAGPHPSVGDGEVTRTVCFTVRSYICNRNREIRLKNCTGYFVYQLWPSPIYNAVYCTATDSALGDPCVTHTVLDQPWRSSDCSHTECSAGTWMGDRNLAVGWYRFNSSGGWKIPETDVPGDHCSGQFPGWLAGPHPSVGDGEVTRTVCFTVGSNICYRNQEIRVKNCTGYFVYQLWPLPYTYAVYCTDPASVPTDESQETAAEPQKTPEPQETTPEPQETATEPRKDVSTVPEPDTTSDPPLDTTLEPQGAGTGDSGPGLTSDPAGSASSDPQMSTVEQTQGSSTGESVQESASVPVGDTSSDPASVPTGESQETAAEPQETPEPQETAAEPQETAAEPRKDVSTVPEPDTTSDPPLDTTLEPQGAGTGDSGPGLTSDPAGSASSDSQMSTVEQTQGSSTGESVQESASVPVGDTSSDPETSTKEETGGPAAGETTQEPSPVPEGDTSSDAGRGTSAEGREDKPSDAECKPHIGPDWWDEECEKMIDQVQVLYIGQSELDTAEQKEAYLQEVRQMLREQFPCKYFLPKDIDQQTRKRSKREGN
ncbi:mucin-5AC-like isoform X2 [Amblyraja radiata]|uniref:mucin-5AC-like isoform X2 n=1 Tax=Amblyraja radiata TaxID=386614 RepID=UPI001403FFD2|nr:mucin-5AC-like isoform X2 [Amblyraja radiata]